MRQRRYLYPLILGIIILIILLFLALQMIFRNEVIANSRGVYNYLRGRYDVAEKHFRKNALNNASDAIATENLAKSLYRKGDYEEAEKSFNNAQANHKNLTELLYNIGNNHYQQKKYDDAIKAYTDALLLDPSDKDIKSNFELALRARMQQQKQDQQGDQEQKEDQKSDKSPENKPDEKEDNEELRNRLRALDQKESSDRRRQQRAPSEQNRNWW